MDSKFDLEQRIAAWRDEMKRAGLKDEVVLEELAAHVREQTISHQANIEPESAFTLAVEHLGNPVEIQREFVKQQRELAKPVTITVSLLVLANVIVAIKFFMLGKIVFGGRAFANYSVQDEAAHKAVILPMAFGPVMFILAALGVTSVFAAGVLAMYFVWARWRRMDSERCERAIVRAIKKLNRLTAMLAAPAVFCAVFRPIEVTYPIFPTANAVIEVISDPKWVLAALIVVFAMSIRARRLWETEPLRLMKLQFIGSLFFLLLPLSGYTDMGFYDWRGDWLTDTLIALNMIFLLLVDKLNKSERLKVA